MFIPAIPMMLTAILVVVLLAPYFFFDLEFLISQEDWGYKMFRVLLTTLTLCVSTGNVIIFNPPHAAGLITAIVLSFAIYLADTIPFVRKLFS